MRKKICQRISVLSFARKCGDKQGKKLIDTATKTAKTVGMDDAKTASKRVVQKIAEATGDLTGNKIADKIISVGKPKTKRKEEDKETNKTQDIFISPERCRAVIDNLRFL